MWYFRQVLGSANLTGGKLFHILSGNLSFQIEHHLFPDIPAFRHAEISAEVQEICRRYGIPYNSGPLPRQFATVVRKIVKLALPVTSDSRAPVATRSPLLSDSMIVPQRRHCRPARPYTHTHGRAGCRRWWCGSIETG